MLQCDNRLLVAGKAGRHIVFSYASLVSELKRGI